MEAGTPQHPPGVPPCRTLTCGRLGTVEPAVHGDAGEPPVHGGRAPLSRSNRAAPRRLGGSAHARGRGAGSERTGRGWAGSGGRGRSRPAGFAPFLPRALSLREGVGRHSGGSSQGKAPHGKAERCSFHPFLPFLPPTASLCSLGTRGPKIKGFLAVCVEVYLGVKSCEGAGAAGV